MNIQIMKTYRESFQNVRFHTMEWVRVASGPLLIWILGALFLAFTYISGGHTYEVHKTFLGGNFVETINEGSALLIFGHIVYGIAYFVAMLSLAINGYRYAILREGGRSWLTFNLNIRFVKMVLYLILISILTGIYTIISAGIVLGFHAFAAILDSPGMGIVEAIIGILLGILGIYLLLRIALYPVAISMDHSNALSTSWRLMKGNVLRYLGLFILIGLTILLIAIILGSVALLVTALAAVGGPILISLSVLVWAIFVIFMVLFSWAVNAKALGLVYVVLGENHGLIEPHILAEKKTLSKKAHVPARKKPL